MLDLDYEEIFNIAMQGIENMQQEDPYKDTKMFSVMKKSYTK